MGVALRLREPVRLKYGTLIIGLSGWVDAGNASTLSLKYLIDKLEASQLGEIAPGKFYDYAAHRPLVIVEDGLLKRYEAPRNLLYFSMEKGRNLVLLLGVEPDLDWPGYAEATLELATTMEARCVYTLGGYISAVPHTVEPPVSGSTNNPELLGELKTVGVELTSYRGPTSVYSEILWEGKRRGVNVVSLWTAIPPYVSGANPKAALSLLRKLTSIIGIQVAFDDIEAKTYDLDRRIAEEAKANPELHRLIEEVEVGFKLSRTKPSYTV